MEDFLLSVSFACRFSLLTPLSLFQVVPTRQTFPFSFLTLQEFYMFYQELPPLAETRNRFLSSRLHSSSHVHKSRLTIPCSVNMATGKSDEPEKLNMDRFVKLLRHFWEIMPQPIKSFPWMAALESFIQINLDLVHAVAKYLCVPLLALSSLSEMSFCAQEKKMIFIPILFLSGFSVAGVLNDTATELSPHLKREEFPWHLLLIAIFFILLKLPGPSFPYWGRIFVPHFANGGLWRTLWFTILWYRKPHDPSTSVLQTPADEIHS
ncbi:hypothetical protein CKAN_01215600 [Cinnamomum micranthum f. kanehirae]|uniref:Uncharacterized protein n=1 Tax=Cinnamomum micranthum f. kanehirae TaxID=337451 RepID=A0A3S4NYQ0_9MAGN|nr:hypothetical protein CKAN_01215600 [Cinnamomum micranthum f. kanehirae]